MITPRQSMTMISHEIPPEIPIRPLSPPVPIVYDDSTTRMEYRVLTRSSLDPTGLEADLSALGREGWWLVQIITQEKQVLLVFMRSAQRARRHR